MPGDELVHACACSRNEELEVRIKNGGLEQIPGIWADSMLGGVENESLREGLKGCEGS